MSNHALKSPPAGLVFGTALCVIVTFLSTLLCSGGCAFLDLQRVANLGEVLADIGPTLRAECQHLPVDTEDRKQCDAAADRADEAAAAVREATEAVNAARALTRGKAP